MRFRLRWKILLFTVLPPVVLTASALWFVNRHFSDRVHENISEALERSSLLFEHMLAARSEKLAISSQVVVRDPRFFAILTVPASDTDSHYRETVRRIAQDFNAVARADLFEVLDGRGRLLASVGTSHASAAARDSLVHQALAGRQNSGVLIESDAHYQAAATPVFADRRIVGVLVLGSDIGGRLARELRSLTRSEVTFISGNEVTGSSLGRGPDFDALIAELRERNWMGAGRVVPRWTVGKLARPGRPGVFDLKTRGESWITLVQSMPQSDPAARQIYLMQRSLKAETAFLAPVRRGLVQLGLIAALAALIAGIVVSEQITRPVHRLVRGAIEMERGNYEFPLGIRSRDEIGFLAQRFEKMREHERDYVSSLEEVARLKGEFLDVAAHELRTPLSIIQGYHELFVAGALGPLNAAQHEALVAIGRGLESLGRIAQDATWMAQLEGERPQLEEADHDVAVVLAGAVKAATSGARDREVEVSLSLEPELGYARLDAARMTQAVASLIRNGIRFTPDGGAVEVASWREGPDLMIEVRDNGIGISEEEQRHLFNRPVVVRDSMHHHSSSELEFQSQGLGIGLAIARAIVEAHGGTIGVTSAPGAGSTFTMRLPERSAEARQAA
jgi:signal transduction histidine kinase